MEFSNEEIADIILTYGAANGNSTKAARIYRERFPRRRIPDSKTFVRQYQRLRDFGIQSGRPGNVGRTRGLRMLDIEQEVLDIVHQNPQISQPRLAELTGVSLWSINRIIRNVGLHPYHYTRVQDLRQQDFQPRREFCEWFNRHHNANPNFSKQILFSDEATFGRMGIFNQRNSHVYSYENPHATRRHHFQSLFAINLWAGVIGDQLIGPFELPPRLNGQSYLEFLNGELENLLDDIPLARFQDMWFQHDGAPAHFSLEVRRHLNLTFPNRWIGRGGPVAWPPRSPDLNPLDFYVWGAMKNHVYATEVDDIQTLRERIGEAANEIRLQLRRIGGLQHQLLNRTRMCRLQNGRHFEHLL